MQDRLGPPVQPAHKGQKGHRGLQVQKGQLGRQDHKDRRDQKDRQDQKDQQAHKDLQAHKDQKDQKDQCRIVLARLETLSTIVVAILLLLLISDMSQDRISSFDSQAAHREYTKPGSITKAVRFGWTTKLEI